MENLTTQLGELFAAVQNSDLRQVRRLLSAHVSPNQCNGEGKTALMIASSIGHPEIIRLLCAAAATHKPPAHLFLDAAITAEEPSPLSPVSAVNGYPAAALAENAPKRIASYSAIIDQPRPTPLLPDYVSAIRVVSKELTPLDTTAAKGVDPVKRDVLDVVVKKGVTVKENKGIRPSGSPKTVSPKTVEAPALAQPNLEDLAVKALLKGDINQLPVPPKPSSQDQSPPGRYDLNGSDAPDITAHYPIHPEPVHPESPDSSEKKNLPTKNSSQTFSAILEEDAVLAEIEAIIKPNQQGSGKENRPNSLREPTPISPNKPAGTTFDNSFLERLPRVDITAAQPSEPSTPASQGSAPVTPQTQADDLSNKTPLEISVLQNDLSRVKALLKAGADFRPATWYDTPVLVTAAEKGYVDIVQTLINAGANVNTGYDRLPLHVAAEHGHLTTAQLLLNSGAYIHSTEEGGRTALIAAASTGQLALVQLLVTKGANLNAVSRGETAIMVAAQNGHRAVYEFLYSLTPNHIRVTMEPSLPPRADRAVSEATVTANATSPSQSLEAPQKNLVEPNSTRAHSLVNELIEAATDGHLPRLVAAMDAGADVNGLSTGDLATGGLATGTEMPLGKARKIGQRTALIAAIQAGHISSVEALLDANASANRPASGPSNQSASDQGPVNQAEIYPLMVAARSSSAIHRIYMIELLILQGARLNQTDDRGRTALIHATQAGNSDAIATLIAAQADLDIRDSSGKTALMHAEASQNQPIIQYLQQAKISQTQAITLLQAITQNNETQVQRILSHGGNPNAVADGISALSQAAAKGYLAIARQLIKAGADLNYRPHRTELNPLLYAAYRGHLEMVQMLITAGADIHVQAGDRLNALTYAKRGQQQKRNAGKPFAAIIALLNSHGVSEHDH